MISEPNHTENKIRENLERQSLMLLIFGGLPACGKSTISTRVAQELHAVHVRVDSIEQTLRDVGFNEVHGEGYAIAYRFAADNLSLGSTVIADSVNPVKITRDAWRMVAESLSVSIIEIEIICSNKEEHRRRVETRKVDVEQLVLPTWEDVLAREYDFWTEAQIVIDTAGESPEQSVKKTLSLIESAVTS